MKGRILDGVNNRSNWKRNGTRHIKKWVNKVCLNLYFNDPDLI